MAFERGDFLLVSYTIRVEETGNLVDTTDPNIAKQENAYDESKVYGPTLIVLGKGWMNQYVEEEITKMSIGEEKIIRVPPEKAFGPRDPNKVKTFSLREFIKRGYEVSVGDVIETKEGRGTVKSISGGRVVVDFNHPLAGKTLVYKVKVESKLENVKDKILYLASRHLGIGPSELSVEYDEQAKKAVITIPSKYVSKQGLQFAKLSLAEDALSLLKDHISSLVFQEVFSAGK